MILGVIRVNAPIGSCTDPFLIPENVFDFTSVAALDDYNEFLVMFGCKKALKSLGCSV